MADIVFNRHVNSVVEFDGAGLKSAELVMGVDVLDQVAFDQASSPAFKAVNAGLAAAFKDVVADDVPTDFFDVEAFIFLGGIVAADQGDAAGVGKAAVLDNPVAAVIGADEGVLESAETGPIGGGVNHREAVHGDVAEPFDKREENTFAHVDFGQRGVWVGLSEIDVRIVEVGRGSIQKVSGLAAASSRVRFSR